MDPQFFSILGLFPAREHDRGGLNEPDAHRADSAWRLGPIPERLQRRLAAAAAPSDEC